jgi:hypothetical protein
VSTDSGDSLGGGGTRSDVLFPIKGFYNFDLSQTTTNSIYVYVALNNKTQHGSDSISITNSFDDGYPNHSSHIVITELQNQTQT